MTTILLVRGNCGDYYCGCGGGHVIGAYSTPELAEAAKEAASLATYAYASWKEPKPVRTWECVGIEEIVLDQMPAMFELHEGHSRAVA